MKKHDIPPHEIRAILVKKQITMAEIARVLGVTRQCVHLSLSASPGGTDVCRKAIADAVGIPMEKLWPSLFDENLNRIERRGRPRKAA